MRLALAGWITRGVVRVWPEETKRWAHAFRGELPEIGRPGASLRWALGGIMLLTRAWWNHLLRSWNRPAGVPEAGPLAELAKNATRVPRTPRFVTALLLLASVAMVFVPDVREGMKATFKVWYVSAFNKEPNYQATVARLRTLSAQHRDPQAMAMVALLADDRTERINMADQAVTLDPSLTWTYAYVRTNGEFDCCNKEVPTDWLDKLQKWDPDNAFVRLVVAHQSYVRLFQAWQASGAHGPFDYEVTKKLHEDKDWLAAMGTAFSEPKYDNYYPRLFDLYRSVALRYGIRETSVASTVLVLRFGNWAVTRDASNYSEFLEDRGAAAEQAGNFQEAERLYKIPARFGDRMTAQAHSDDRFSWEWIEGNALRKLQPLLVKAGRTNEAALADAQINALQVDRSGEGPAVISSRMGNGWEGFMIRFSTAAIFAFGVLSLVGLGALFLRRRVPVESRGFGMALASLVVDFCPLLLLLGCAGLYVAYRPVALMYEQYLTWSTQIYDFRGLMQALYTPYGSPEGINRIFYVYLTPPNLWMALIVALSMVAVYILLRGLLRKRVAIAS
jgi:hypothetical protein